VNYILKSIPADCRARAGFLWPTEPGAIVTAPDWDPAPQCGGGLHGALNGAGDGSLFCWDDDAVWICAEIIGDDIVDLGGKVKVRQCRIICAGARDAAAGYLVAQGMSAVIGGTATAGDYGTATAGDGGTATAGDGGTATAGRGGTATAGRGGTATAGDGGTATAGDGGTATAGDGGTATAGVDGTATAGDYGTATAGYRGTATAGDGGTATAGDDGTATAGDYGTVIITWHDAARRRLAIGYVGEDGIEPNVAYRLSNGKMERA